MKIWYVRSWGDHQDLGQFLLFPSIVKAMKHYKNCLREAKAALKLFYDENDGVFDSGAPMPKDWLDQRSVELEARAIEPDFFEMPSSPTKAQIIKQFSGQ